MKSSETQYESPKQEHNLKKIRDLKQSRVNNYGLWYGLKIWISNHFSCFKWFYGRCESKQAKIRQEEKLEIL